MEIINSQFEDFRKKVFSGIDIRSDQSKDIEMVFYAGVYVGAEALSRIPQEFETEEEAVLKLGDTLRQIQEKLAKFQR